MRFQRNRLEGPVLMTKAKPLPCQFGIHHRLESCAGITKCTIKVCDSYGGNARGEVEGPQRALCQLEKPFKGLKVTQGYCWEEQKRILFL